jgi:hypothetical protein
MAEKTNVKYFLDNDDIVGETGVCVARCLFGACAFPERHTRGDYYLWAVNLKGLTGYDTEKAQGERVWRPGEKVFLTIPPDAIVGHCVIQRKGTYARPELNAKKTKVVRASDGWVFEIPPATKWTFLKSTTEQQKYLESELVPWYGRHEIPGDWDFAG